MMEFKLSSHIQLCCILFLKQRDGKMVGEGRQPTGSVAEKKGGERKVRLHVVKGQNKETSLSNPIPNSQPN